MSENSITPIYAEWLIWAQRSKLKIDSLQEDVSRQSIALSQIGLLQKEIAEIVVRNDHLQSENDNLRDRVLNLEQEINQQDQINAMKSQVQQISEDRIDTLWREFANVLSAVDFMQKDASIRREGQQKLLDDLHAQVRAATNRTSPTVQSPGDLGSKDLTQRILTPFRSSSRASTTDEALQTDLQNDQTLLMANTQLYNESLGLTQTYSVIPKITLAAQGESTTQEYVTYGDSRITLSLRRYEDEAVTRFVNGMSDKDGKALLSDILDRKGWTWEIAKTEISRLLQDGGTR